MTTKHVEKSFANGWPFRRISDKPRNRLRHSLKRRSSKTRSIAVGAIRTRNFGAILSRRSWDGCCRAGASRDQSSKGDGPCRDRTILLAMNSPRVLDPHLVGNAGFRQPHEFGKRCIRPARAAGQQRDQACDRSVAVSVERAQVNVPRGAAGRAIDPIGSGAGPREQRRSSARTATAFAGPGARSKRLLAVPRPQAPGHRSRAWRPQRRLWPSAQLPSCGG